VRRFDYELEKFGPTVSVRLLDRSTGATVATFACVMGAQVAHAIEELVELRNIIGRERDDRPGRLAVVKEPAT